MNIIKAISRFLKLFINSLSKFFYSNNLTKNFARLISIPPPLWRATNKTSNKKYFGQNEQDRWVMEEVYPDEGFVGFYIEMGAGDGILLSNTYALELAGWKGLLIEPTKSFLKLKNNRNAICENCCVGAEKGEIYVVEVPGFGFIDVDRENTLRTMTFMAESTEVAYRKARQMTLETDGYDINDYDTNVYPMRVELLADLLDKHDAPEEIDYFSLDVEGFEYEVLRNFPFDRYRFKSMNIERPNKELRQLLKEKGYVPILQDKAGDIFYFHSTFEESRN